MTFNSQNIINEFADLIISENGSHGEIEEISPYQDAKPNSLVFIQETSQLEKLQGIKPAVIITNNTLAQTIDANAAHLVISVHNVGVAHALIKQRYNDYQSVDAEWPEIHPSAVVHSSAVLGDNVRIGPNVTIGANCTLGAGTVVRANSVIEHDATLGANCVINSLVNIGYACLLGDRVIIHAGTIIGNEGFGLAPDQNKHYQRIPHTGTVLIGDDVQIGSNCNIDRGTYSATTIKYGVKIDSLCHIAHNVVIDEHTLLVAQTGVAGSSKIGKHVIISGQSAISDHKSVADGAILVHRCGVTEDITEAGTWAGTPAKPFKEYVQGLNLVKKVQRLSQRLKQLEKSLDEK